MMAGYATFHDLRSGSVFITVGRSSIGEAMPFLTSKSTRIMTLQTAVVYDGEAAG